MEFLQKARGFSDKEEEEEDEEEEEKETRNFACNFFPHRGQMQWLLDGNNNNSHHTQDLDTSRSYSHQAPTAAAEAINFHGKLQLMDLSLRIDSSGGGGTSGNGFVEREHMFDKVVTPSDVGKLNRLVIPKQHAEKYFPLDSSTNEKGLILNFEDRNGKPWRFRYSYWNSSQSYVMTKGWSRFVKEKKLDAGDIVSFDRGVGEFGKDRLFIDWRRRPDATTPPNHFTNPLLLRWGARHYTVPPSPAAVPSPPWRSHHHHHEHLQYSNIYPNYSYDMSNLGTNSSLYYLRSSSHRMATTQQGGGQNQGSSDVIESVPVIFNGGKKSRGGTNSAKRLRLFGVNMECAATDEEDDLCNAVPLAQTDQISTRGKEPSSELL